VGEAFTWRADYEGRPVGVITSRARAGDQPDSWSWRPAAHTQRAQRRPAPESEARRVNAFPAAGMQSGGSDVAAMRFYDVMKTLEADLKVGRYPWYD
jgi:hypothetical protein